MHQVRVAAPGDQLLRGLRFAARVQRGPRPGLGLRLEDRILDPVVRPREAEPRLGPHAAHHREPLRGARVARVVLIARSCDAYLMHGDPPERIAAKVADLRARRERLGLPPLKFGVAGYVVCRPTEAAAQREVARITDVRQSAAGYAIYQEWIANTQLEQRVSLEDYSVSNRGLKAGLVGTPRQIADRIHEFEQAGVELLLLQFSPQYEEMERFADQVMPALTPRAHAGNLAGHHLKLGTPYS